MSKKILSLHFVDTYGAEGLANDVKIFYLFRFYTATLPTGVLIRASGEPLSIEPLSVAAIGQALEVLLEDVQPDLIRIGYLPDETTIKLVAQMVKAFKLLKEEQESNPKAVPGVLVEPSMYLYKKPLYDVAILHAYQQHLFPLANIVVLNTEETAELTGRVITNIGELKGAAEALREMGMEQAVLTGGDLEDRARDVVIDTRMIHTVDGPRYSQVEISGRSGSLACLLAGYFLRGQNLKPSVEKARAYLMRAMQHHLEIGNQLQPLNLNMPLQA